MGNVWLKIKIWTKGLIFGAFALYALVFFLRNDKTVEVWYWPWKAPYNISLIWLTLIVLVIGVLGTLLVRTTFKTIRQIREARAKSRLDKIERDHADMKAKAAMLQTKTASGTAAKAAADVTNDQTTLTDE
jgi:uncharacterized integral membrane protein